MVKQILYDLDAFVFGARYAAYVYENMRQKRDKEQIKKEIKKVVDEVMKYGDLYYLFGGLIEYYIPSKSEYIELNWINYIQRYRKLFLKGFSSFFEEVVK